MTHTGSIFTREYWLTEAAFFRVRMEAPDLQDDEAARLVNGICYLASKVVEQEPSTKQETLDEFVACYRLAKGRMGEEWIMRHMQIINTHGGPPPGEDNTPT